MTTGAFSAVAFYIWTRHRVLVIGAAAVYLAIVLTYDTAWARDGKPFVEQMLVFLRAAPFFLPLLLCTSAVSVATADLATGESWYPKHFFRLPLGTHALALPFMAYTVGLYALTTLAAVVITDGRAFLTGPLQAPAELLPKQAWQPYLPLAELVWTQALIWTPFRRRWTRIALMLGIVAAYFAALIFALNRGAPDAWVVGLSLAQVPLAYAVAIRGIARARRGDAWQGVQSRPRAPRRARRGTRAPFANAGAAQAWFESKVQRSRAGFVTTFVVPLLLFCALVANLVAGREGVEAAGVAQRVVGLMLFVLGFVALATGPAFATFNVAVQTFKNEAFRMPAFFAALPLSTGEFAWAKLRTAARRMAFIAAVALAAAIGVFVLTGMPDRWSGEFSAFGARHGELEARVLVVLAAAAFLGLTAAGTANFVWIGLMGRKWRFANVVIVLVFIAALAVPGWVVARPGRVQTAVEILRVSLPVLAALKVLAVGVLAYLTGARRLYSWDRVAWTAGVWGGAVVLCFAAYTRYLPEGVMTATTAASTLVLLLPVLGIIGAPLALQRNRCR